MGPNSPKKFNRQDSMELRRFLQPWKYFQKSIQYPKLDLDLGSKRTFKSKSKGPSSRIQIFASSIIIILWNMKKHPETADSYNYRKIWKLAKYDKWDIDGLQMSWRRTYRRNSWNGGGKYFIWILSWVSSIWICTCVHGWSSLNY